MWESTFQLLAFAAFFLKLFTNLKSMNNNRTNAPCRALPTFPDLLVVSLWKSIRTGFMKYQQVRKAKLRLGVQCVDELWTTKYGITIFLLSATREASFLEHLAAGYGWKMCHSYLVENSSEEFVFALTLQYLSIWYSVTGQAGGVVPPVR